MLSGMTQLADTLARAHTTKAIQTLVEVMEGGPTIDDEGMVIDGYKASDRISAAKEILDRGYGKPTQAIITLPAQPKVADRLAGMSDADLLATIGAARIARQHALPAIESTVVSAEDDPLCA